MSEAVQIGAVQPTNKELRPLRRGWGAMHWLASAPWVVPYLGLLTLMALLIAYAGPRLAVWIPFTIVLATYALWIGAAQWLQRELAQAWRRSPSGRTPFDWTIDATGVTQTNGVMTSHFAWQAVRELREEPDRFVFLVTPQTNPVLPRRLLDQAQTASLRSLIDAARSDGRLGRGVD